jgi:hypothetical protein
MLTLLNWNLEWKKAGSRPGREILRIISASNPTIICLAEAYDDFLDPSSWHSVYPDGDSGYPTLEGRRKVMLGSRSPWTETMTDLDNAPPGRFVSGLTDSTVGPVRVHGVCVPWSHAHVSTGRQDRKAWEDHAAFLKALLAHDGLVDPVHPTILVGDFNQTFPPKRAPEEARRLLSDLLDKFEMAPPKHVEHRTVCHTLLSPKMRGTAIGQLPATSGGLRLSDHHGHVHRLVTSHHPGSASR